MIQPLRSRIPAAIVASVMAAVAVPAAWAEPAHGIAMYGDPALPDGFDHFPYTNPDAPKGGRIVLGEGGGFDSLNPFILKGSAPYGVGVYVFETLMARSWDEPFTLYGWLAATVETDENRSWVEFTLRPEATFSDGAPVTVEDVIWSYETLGTQGHPRYLGTWEKVAKVEATGPMTVRFTFTGPDRELPLLLGMRPILKKEQWEGRDFGASGLDMVPVGSGPYVIDDVDPGRSISLVKDPDWWGRNVPAMRGQHNLDEIRYEYFGDGDVVFEAFKAGTLTSYREGNAGKWATQYDFPRVRSGEVVQSLIPHQRPTGITGFAMNTRRAPFDDWRVREAMMHAFNFEFMNATLNDEGAPRITSYYSNSVLGMDPGPAEGRVADLLAPMADDLLPGAIEGYTFPAGDGTARNRAGLARARDLLAEAGYEVQDGTMTGPDGPLTFEIVLSQNASETQRMVDIFAAALNRLGIFPTVTTVDSAQYTERTTAFDFGMAYYTRGLSLSPGAEQRLYWGSEAADVSGSRNWMGVQNPAVDALIEAMLASETRDDFIAATRALDRALTSGRYVIPVWTTVESRLAHDARLHYPADRLPIYGDWIGFQPDVWWWEE